MGVEHQVDVGHFALAMGDSDVATLRFGQMFGAGQMIAINQHAVLGRHQQIAFNPEQSFEDQDRLQIGSGDQCGMVQITTRSRALQLCPQVNRLCFLTPIR